MEMQNSLSFEMLPSTHIQVKRFLRKNNRIQIPYLSFQKLLIMMEIWETIKQLCVDTGRTVCLGKDAGIKCFFIFMKLRHHFIYM